MGDLESFRVVMVVGIEETGGDPLATPRRWVIESGGGGARLLFIPAEQEERRRWQ